MPDIQGINATADQRNAAKANPAEQNAQGIEQASRQFETLLLHQVIKQMQETVEYSALDEDDEGGQQMFSLYGMFLADAIGQQGGLGFGRQIGQQLISLYAPPVDVISMDKTILDERL